MSAMPHEPLAVPPPESGQLAYASAKGGFGVQGTTGGVTPEESTTIVSGINRDRREFGQDLPPFVSPADAARLHRNFTVQPTPVGLVTWLSGPAGMDGSGRPGNVFTHALLERYPRPRDAPRPIDRWRSRAWLTPYGAVDVESARLPEAFGDDHPVVHREAAIAFIRDPDAWRVGTLCALLDALTSSADAPVLVGVSSPEEAAQWMGAISHLVGRPYAERLGFSLWEAANTMTTRRVRSKFVFVPEHQLDPSWTTSITRFVVRTSDEPAPRDWEPGAAAASPFGPLAASLFSFFDNPSTVLAQMDAIADRLGADADQPGWPLAMALARHVETWPELAGPVAEALVREAPGTLDAYPDLWDVAVRVVSRYVGGSADRAWEAIQAFGAVPVPMRDALRKVHLGLRLEHPQHLVAAPGPPPVVGAGRWSAWQDPAIFELVEQGIRTARAADPLTGAVLVLRITNAVCGETMPGSSSPGMAQALHGAVTDLVLPLLDQPDPTALVRACGPLGGSALFAIVRPALAEAPVRGSVREARAGSRIHPDVVSWLYPAPPAVAASAPVTELDAEAAAAFAPLGLLSPWWRWVRSVVLRYAVTREPATRVDALVAATVPRDNLTVSEARTILAAGPGRLPIDHLLGSIAMMGPGDDVDGFLWPGRGGTRGRVRGRTRRTIGCSANSAGASSPSGSNATPHDPRCSATPRQRSTSRPRSTCGPVPGWVSIGRPPRASGSRWLGPRRCSSTRDTWQRCCLPTMRRRPGLSKPRCRPPASPTAGRSSRAWPRSRCSSTRPGPSLHPRPRRCSAASIDPGRCRRSSSSPSRSTPGSSAKTCRPAGMRW